MAGGAPTAAVPAVLAALAEALAASPHLEFLLTWVHALCLRHDVSQQVHFSPIYTVTTYGPSQSVVWAGLGRSVPGCQGVPGLQGHIWL